MTVVHWNAVYSQNSCHSCVDIVVCLGVVRHICECVWGRGSHLFGDVLMGVSSFELEHCFVFQVKIKEK